MNEEPNKVPIENINNYTKLAPLPLKGGGIACAVAGGCLLLTHPLEIERIRKRSYNLRLGGATKGSPSHGNLKATGGEIPKSHSFVVRKGMTGREYSPFEGGV